ncbi:alpha/beta hydrolase [Stakelama marina]|uniref:Alpha/beta hydrolase n=1 Tax=Stakelama marina TaxID=2826939 RepID=A0A8T4IG69_9SPHN|nr:alpha/beta hydrolase [Stakelama marina]MBR0552874.1 alpha/beta hydrolase [Stakelama marina]
MKWQRTFGLVAALLVSALLHSPALAQQRTYLWEHGAPGLEARADIPEISKDYWTKHVNNPSITAYLPDPKNATGTAIVILPGGGHRLLVTTTEGSDVAHWLADRGVAAFVVRYRLFREEGSPYSEDDARADAERAMRMVRHDAAQYGIDPHRIGVWGFSAGGELARMVTLSPPVAPRGTPDAIDAVSEKPDFAILEFPGPLHAEEHVTAESPPVLLAAANDDTCCSGPTVDVLNAYRKAGASVEMHLYAAGGHAFNMGEDTPLVSLQHWPERVIDWLSDRGLLYHPAPVFVPK